MQIGMQKHVDIATAVEEEFDGEIEANAVAIYAQISGLAKDKVGYGVREIPSNAWDASRGNFEVHLPTQLSPIFRVRDYGTGISPENMRNVYGKLYASDKRKDDNKVGGWGLGSKSPFAYLLGPDGAGSYTVTSYYEGMMRTYTISLSEEGKIKIRRLCELPTTEPSGLEVSYPVRREDIHTFHARAHKILWSFNPRPRIYPEGAVVWKEPVIEAQGEGWTRYKAGTVPFSQPQVRMGCVMYPFDLGQIENTGMLDVSDVIVFEAPIGSLKVTLSREELAYDEITKTTLKNLVGNYEQTFISQVQAKVNEATNLFQATKVYEDETQTLGSTRQDRLRKVVKWNGHHLGWFVSRDGLKTNLLRDGWQTFDKFDNHDVRKSICADATIVIEHNPSYSYSRFMMAGLVGKKVLWIRCKRIDRERVLAQLGNPDVINLDDYKVPVEKRVSKTIRKRRTLVVGERGVTKVTQDIDLADGGYYVEVSGTRGWGRSRDWYSIGGVHGSIAAYDFDSFIATCVELGVVEVGQVILLKDRDSEVGENWAPLGVELVNDMKALIDNTQFTGLHQKTINNLSRDLRNFNDAPLWRNIPEDIKAFRRELAELVRNLRAQGETTSTTSDKAHAALARIGVHIDKPDIACPIKAIENKYQALCRTYPLLHLIIKNSGYYRMETEAVGQLRHYLGLLHSASQPEVQVVGVNEAEEEEEDDLVLDQAA